MWDTFRAKVREKAGLAKSATDTHEAIRFAVTLLNDSHGEFFAPGVAVGGGGGSSSGNLAMPVGVAIGPVAYLTVPSFFGAAADARRYADSLQMILRALDRGGPCGWIVDVRSNLGSNMYPMLAGIGALVGEGVLGYFIDPDNRRTGWFQSGGSAGAVDVQGNITVVHRLANNPYSIRVPRSPIAVVAGGGTLSSGEALVITFRGKQRTRSFGARTGGFSTATVQYALSDGATLLLTTSTMADRTGRLFGGQIDVDEVVPDATRFASSTDSAAVQAVAWLRAQTECAGR